MSKVVAAVGIIALGVATGGLGFGAVGTFLTTSTFGRLLTTVALSALRAALTRQKGGSAGPQPGIRTAQTQTGGTNPASFILGKYATEGTLAAPTMSHGTVGGVPNAYLTYVIELGDIPGQNLEGLYIDGELVTLGSVSNEYGAPFEGRFAGYGWVKFYNGFQTAADPMLRSKYGADPVRPWTPDMVGAGICYAIVTTRYNRNIFTSFPKVRFVMGGIPLYDPRKDGSVGGVGAHRWEDRSTWEQTENPAVQIYNIKRGIDLGGGYIWGGGAAAEDLPLSNWWAAMNKADQQIALDGGGTEPQYRASYEVFVDDEPAKVIEEILNACSGEVAENGGVWKIRLGGPGLPVFFFDDSDIIITETEEYSPFRAEQEPYNGVSVVYPDPDALWEPRDAPVRYNAEYALADPSQRRVADLTLSAAPYPNQVQRVMRAYVEEERRIIRHVLSLPPDALTLETLDVVAYSSARHGYSAKAFEIDAHIDPLLTGAPRVTLKERDPDDAAWIPDYELPTPNVPTSVTELPPQTVDDFAVSATSIEDENGNPARPAILLTWAGQQEDVRGLEYEVQAADGTSIINGSTLNVAAGEFVVAEGILPNKDYKVRAKFVVFRPTTWTDFLPVTTLDLRIRPEDLDTPTFQTSGLALFGGDLRSDDYVQDISGWKITNAGDAEFNSLVSRSWVIEGAVSQGANIAGYPTPGFVGSGGVIQEFRLGPFSIDEFWQIGLSVDFRHAGRRYRSTGPTYDVYDLRSRFFFEINRRINGVWTGYQNMRTTFFSPFLVEYQTNAFAVPVMGNYEDVFIRTTVELREELAVSGVSGPMPADYDTVYFKNLAYIGKAVVR